MTWDGNGRALSGVCKPSCCKTPLGHSGAAPASCTCHPVPLVPKVDPFVNLFAGFDGDDAA